MSPRTYEPAGGTRGTVARGTCAAGLLALLATAANGQAWVPPAGVGEVGVLFQYVDHTGHFLADGSIVRGYDGVSRGALLSFDYAFTNRLSMTAAVAYVSAKYLGPNPSFSGLEIDECHCWNDGWQDGSLALRYNILNGAFALTPSIAYGTPVADYPYYGEAVIGRHLDEVRLAVDAGWRLDALSPKLSLTGRYAYSFVEKVIDLDTDRSNLLLNIGWEFNPRLSASLDFYLQRTHGGLKSTEIVTDAQWAEYDRIVKDDSFHMGATFAYSFERVDLFASYIEFVDGTDTHDGRAYSFGIGVPFQF